MTQAQFALDRKKTSAIEIRTFFFFLVALFHLILLKLISNCNPAHACISVYTLFWTLPKTTLSIQKVTLLILPISKLKHQLDPFSPARYSQPQGPIFHPTANARYPPLSPCFRPTSSLPSVTHSSLTQAYGSTHAYSLKHRLGEGLNTLTLSHTNTTEFLPWRWWYLHWFLSESDFEFLAEKSLRMISLHSELEE